MTPSFKRPRIAFTLPLAVLLSILTAVMGAWIAVQRAEATLGVRMDAADKQIETMQTRMDHDYASEPEFSMAVADLKRELDEIRSDVKEIRRGVDRR